MSTNTKQPSCRTGDNPGVPLLGSGPLNRRQCLEIIIHIGKEVPIVFTTGYTCRQSSDIADRDNHFYMVGSMGMACSVGIGLALGNDKPVIVVDGDGSLLMNLSGPFLAAHLGLCNLIHIVLDNGQYESTGGQTSISPSFDWMAIFVAIGYGRVVRISDLSQLDLELQQALVERSGPELIYCKTSPAPIGNCARLGLPLSEIYRRFRARCSRIPFAGEDK